LPFKNFSTLRFAQEKCSQQFVYDFQAFTALAKLWCLTTTLLLTTKQACKKFHEYLLCDAPACECPLPHHVCVIAELVKEKKRQACGPNPSLFSAFLQVALLFPFEMDELKTDLLR
jgi:hypothetical protein